MAKRTTPQEEDRVVNTRTGETGTIIDVHPNKGHDYRNFTVLPDRGKRATQLWQGNECEVHFGKAYDCKRCGEKGHNAINCDKGDL